ncbi:MAG TPA: hypothetical protein VMD55_02735 [Terracidiphilus sp.]|nr:hypothetical protein [Terracidiphilus sp.]
MRSVLASVCLVTATCTGVALAESPVAYVYVAEQGPNQITTGPIFVYAASSAGKLTEIKGSPFTQAQTTGYLIGTNGTHFLAVDANPQTSHQYQRSYDVSSDGAIGDEVSTVDLHEWCDTDDGGKLDHTGQYVYVLDAGECGGNMQSFSISKTGQLSLIGNTGSSADDAPIFALPVIAGNDMFAYTWNNSSDTACPNEVFSLMTRESSGALENDSSFTETDPAPPAGDQAYQYFPGLATDDPTNHLATVVYFGDNGDCNDTQPQLASYTVENNGDLVSTNTYQDMPYPAQPTINQVILNPAGNILAVSTGTGIQFFHFNGASPITPFTGIIGTSGYISTMSWDKDNHLYALNALSGRLHVYTASSTGVVEAPGSPYNLPYCGYAHNATNCPQTLIVRRIP